MACPGGRRRRSLDDALVPMINVVFLLLVFFLTAGKLARREESAVALPRTAGGGPAAEERALTLVLTPSGTLLLEGEPIPLEELSERLPADAELALAADRATPAAALFPVLSALAETGRTSVRLLVEREVGR